MKPGALLLLLLAAAAASQVDVSQSVMFHVPGGKMDISSCPISYYGRLSSWIQVKINRGSSLEVCFKTEQTDPGSECLRLLNKDGSNNVMVTIRSSTTAPGSEVHESLSSITSTSTCYVSLEFKKDSTDTINFYFYNFDTQAAFKLLSLPAYTTASRVSAAVGGRPLSSLTFTKNETTSGAFTDISSCRVSGTLLPANSSAVDPESCSVAVCSPAAVLSSTSTCGPLDVCLGNNTCEAPFVCTVTGSTVIDFFSRVVSIRDRCRYRLMKTPGSSPFVLVAGFQERRRTDVSFLDHLIIKQRAGNIHLEQGGRVQVGNQTLHLDATTQEVYGVKLSKGRTGVTAEMPFGNMKVFFDGNTAHVSGPKEALEGLCGSPSTPGQTFTPAETKSSLSAPGCDTLHNDTIDGTINCTRSREHCRLLKQWPFSACRQHADPEPYVAACQDTLCKYPAVDGVDCRFMEAYAEACRLKANITLSGWRSTVNCSAAGSPASCLEHHCSDHEFCGEKLGGTSCLCRALFASKYKPTNALGEPTVCTENSATVRLAGCLLQDKGIDYSLLHLNDSTCKGHMDNQTHMVTFSFDRNNTCGTEVLINSQILYKNAIVMKSSSENSIITRHDQLQIDFSCVYTKPDIKSVSFRIRDSSVVQKIVSGVWTYTLMMLAYTDAGRMNPISRSTDVQLNQTVWLELKTEGLDGNKVAVVTDSCWATNQPLSNGSLRYDLVTNGCPNSADQTVKMEGNGLGTSNSFSFNMFQFSGESTEIYLHCKLKMCPKRDQPCAPTCSGATRRRRSSRSDSAEGNPALITMAWSN